MEVIELIMCEFRRLKCEALPEEELRRAKDQLKGNIILGLESSMSRMSNLARQEMYLSLIHIWVWIKLAPRIKVLVVGKKLAFQDVEPGELPKQIAGSLRDRAHGICRMKLLPGGEILLGLLKIQVVHTLEALLDLG